MRKTINENPLVQIGLLGVLALVVAVVFLMQMGGGDDEVAPAPSAAQPATSVDPTAAKPAEKPAGAAATAEPTGPAEPPAVAGGIKPSEGLPGRFAEAYEKGDPVAIFVVRDEPVSDKVVARYADRLQSEGGTSVIVIEPEDLSDWVRVIGPVGIDRTPALVMVSPKDGNAQPLASVSYGFRNYESVSQAVADARYDGPLGGYDPD